MSDNLVNTNSPGRPKDMAKRQAILEAAKILFLSNGYANTSMDAVALEAGVSKLTVYSHFTDKETLFTAAVMAKCEEQLPVMYFELPEGVPVETVLLNIGRRFHRLVNSKESVNLHRLMMTTGNQDVKLSQIFFEAGPMRDVARHGASARAHRPERRAEHRQAFYRSRTLLLPAQGHGELPLVVWLRRAIERGSGRSPRAGCGGIVYAGLSPRTRCKRQRVTACSARLRT